MVSERRQPAPGPVRYVAALAVALLAPAAVLAVAGPGSDPGAAVWPTAGLAVLAAGRRAGPALAAGSGVPRSWRAAYYAGLLVLLTCLIAWSPWFMLVSWTACV
jgi:hypothetical protein